MKLKKGYKIDVLENSFVRYIRHLGADGDLIDSVEPILQADSAITEAARMSYLEPSKGPEKDKKLLRYLFKNKHTSPFEMVNITFNIRMPIFVMRQFVRHRTFRLNEISARYTELNLGFYVPKKWRAQGTKNKQGSIATKDLDHQNWTDELIKNNLICANLYSLMLYSGVSREMARMVLPVGALTEIMLI